MKFSGKCKSNQVKTSSNKRRSQSGQGLAELCAAMIVCMGLILSCIDLAYIALGASINDNICKDAARAAASGPPANNSGTHVVRRGEAPYDRVLAVIKEHCPTNFPMKVQEQPTISENVRDLPPTEVGGAVDGEITVKTTIDVVPPFVLRYFKSPVALTSSHIVPYTYVIVPPSKAKGEAAL